MSTRVILLSTFVLALAVTVCGPGLAYEAFPTPEDMGLNYTFAVGAAIPITDNPLVDDHFPDIQLAWYGTLAEENFGSMAALGLSFDWIGVDRSDGTNVNLVPILLNYKQSAFISSYRVFVNLGVGIWVTTDELPELRRDDGVSFAWNAGAGIDITNRLYAQFRFLAGENPSDDGLASIQLGYRF